jgi:hypothetical protein
MKIGKLEFRDFAAKKPLSISPAGKYLTANDIISEKGLQLGSLLTLSKEKQIKLVIDRYNLEPEFKLGVIGIGLLTKKEVIAHIEKQDAFGQTVVEAEMGYCRELIDSLGSGKIPKEPVMPNKTVPEVPDWKPIKKCILLRLKTRALFCENTTDSVTSPFAVYRAGHVIPAFTARGFNVVILSGVDDVRTKFVPEAKNPLTVYISGIGHGSYTLYTGNNGNHILEVGLYDPAEVKGKGIHFLSCETAKTLGPDTVAKGARFFAGYTENFNLVWDNPSSPVNEFECFAEADSTFDIAMANGATAQQAFNATIASFNVQLSKPGIPGSVAASWLMYDRDHLALHGDGTATLSPYRLVRICFPIKKMEQENALVEAGEFEEE